MARRPMKSKSRRYEVLLPVRFNDGKDVPDELLGEAVNEIVDQFNAVTFYKGAVERTVAARRNVVSRRSCSPRGRCHRHREKPQMDERIQGKVERAPCTTGNLDG